MIDIQYIRDNPEKVAEATKNKGYNIDIKKLLELDGQRRNTVAKLEQLRQERNQLSGGNSTKPTDEQITKGRELKRAITELEKELEPLEKDFVELHKAVPNLLADDVPIGGEKDFKEVSKYGDTPKGAIDHVEFVLKRDWVDFDRGTRIAGNKFYFIKGDLGLLENAVVQFALDLLVKKGFTYMTVPHLVTTRTLTGAGFSPRSSKQSDEYFIEGEDLALIATAEIPLTGYHTDEIINEDDLPLKYAGYSACYRKEAGTYGKHTRGLFRVHQFNKLEMYAFTLPEKSPETHEELRAIEEEIWQAIGIPYRVINIASGDLGAPAAKKYDIEYWSPVDGVYRELTSCSNCTDYQTRNLNIKLRRTDGRVEFLHSLNGTAIATARTLVAIIENFQEENYQLKVPKVLQPYMGGREKI
jgi:seryl-tRNA synthetase